MSIITDISYIDRVEVFAEENDNVGHFAALNLNYNCSNFQIKKNYESLVKELKDPNERHSNGGNEDGETRLFDRLTPNVKKKFLAKVESAYQILSNEDSKKSYVDDIKLRCLVSQVQTAQELKDKYSDRMFPFFLFEVFKKKGGLFSSDGTHRFFCFNFIDMTIEEKKENGAIKAFNCSSIEQAVTAFKSDEVYLTVNEANETITYHYQMKYPKQRELFLEMLIFARQLAKKRTNEETELMRNPNYHDIPDKKSKKSTKKLMKNFLKVGNYTVVDGKPYKAMMNDRILPTKSLYKLPISKKVGGIRSSEKKMWLHCGVTHILISADLEARNILHFFPIDSETLTLSKGPEYSSFTIMCSGTKFVFKADHASDIEELLKYVNAVIRGEYENDNIIQSLPFNKKDMNVAKILKLRLKGINDKLRKAKQLVHNLRHKREEIRVMLVREEKKQREAGYNSGGDGSSNSQTSISVARGGHAHSGYRSRHQIDDLNESFFSMNTSISRSPINKDRTTTTSIETSMVDFRNNRENRFGVTNRKSPTFKNYRKTREEEGLLIIPNPENNDLKLSSNNSQSSNLAKEAAESEANKEVTKIKMRGHKLTFSKKDTPDWGAIDRKTISSDKTEEDHGAGSGDAKIQVKVNGEGGEFSKRDDLLKLISEMKESKSGNVSEGPPTKSDLGGEPEKGS